MPPPEYCIRYCSTDSSDSVLRAALTPIAKCPVTGVEIKTPLNARNWALRLVASRYPAQAAATLVKCLRVGVDLGYEGQRSASVTGANPPSALEHEAAIDADMAKQLALGRRLGPFDEAPLPFFKANPLGVVFKKGKPKPRVVHNLSWPRNGDNVNASVRDFDVNLSAFDRAVDAIRTSPGLHMAKIDIEAAYRCIPVRPADWALQGMQWRGKFYMDIVMQFGLASATAIFEWYSSAAEFIARSMLHLHHLEHYVDDFFMMHATHEGCARAVQQLLALFAELGLPVAPDKVEGPAQLMVFLGIYIDTINMTLSLDAERLAAIEAMLAEWSQRKTASREELQSLIGILSFAAKVVRAGRIFLRRMIDQLKRIPSWAFAATQFPLSDSFHRDVKWWTVFVREWNGKSLIKGNEWHPKAKNCVEIHTDACSTGYGALCNEEWFAGKWTAAEEEEARRGERDSMPWKELHVIVRAAATWGGNWRGMHVRLRSDCQPVVDAWQKGDSRCEAQASLLRTLLYLTATHDFTLTILHIPGVDNVHADLLSRGQIAAFLALPGKRSPSPTIPSAIPTPGW